MHDDITTNLSNYLFSFKVKNRKKTFCNSFASAGITTHNPKKI